MPLNCPKELPDSASSPSSLTSLCDEGFTRRYPIPTVCWSNLWSTPWIFSLFLPIDNPCPIGWNRLRRRPSAFFTVRHCLKNANWGTAIAFQSAPYLTVFLYFGKCNKSAACRVFDGIICQCQRRCLRVMVNLPLPASLRSLVRRFHIHQALCGCLGRRQPAGRSPNFCGRRARAGRAAPPRRTAMPARAQNRTSRWSAGWTCRRRRPANAGLKNPPSLRCSREGGFY